MKKEWSEEELKEIARQLSNPDGETGVKTGERMNLSNGNMIRKGFESLAIKNDEYVLEIGPGNGSHIAGILDIRENFKYFGVDISETMIREAKKINQKLIEKGDISFSISDGNTLLFSDNSFDKIVTVNTVYFWQNPVAYAKEVLRVLKQNGIFSLVFSDKCFMQQLPFAKFGFELYDKDMGADLLKNAGFKIVDTIEEMEITQNNLGEAVQRPIVIIRATK